MSFLQVLKNYPSRLKSLTNNLDNSVANLKLKQTNEVKDCDKQISLLKDIIKSNDSKINSLKKSLYDVVSYQYGDKSYDLLKTYLDPLKVKQSDIFPSGSVSDFEKLKTDIKNLLVDNKTINEKKIPLEEDKKKKVLAQHKKDMDLLNNKNNNALNGFINPIKDEYNKEFKNCVTNYTTRSVVKENTNMPNTICIGNYYFKTNKQYETLSSTNYLYTPCYINIKTEGNIAIQSNLSEFYDNLAEVENVLCGITLKYIESFPSDKQIHIRLISAVHIRGHTANAHFVQQFFAFHAHHVHGHLTGYKLHPVIEGLPAERLERIHALLLHQVAHHLCADAQHVQLGELQLSRIGREHQPKHLAEEVFLHCGLPLFLDGIQSPEGEEDGHFLARGRCTVGQDKRGQCLVKVVAEEDKGLAFPTPCLRCGRPGRRILLGDAHPIHTVLFCFG